MLPSIPKRKKVDEIIFILRSGDNIVNRIIAGILF